MPGPERRRRPDGPTQAEPIGDNEPKDTPKVLWRPGQKFQPQAIDSVLGIGNRIEHPLFGKGFVWEVVPHSRTLTRLELFPKIKLARLHLAYAAGEYKTREYPVDSITIATSPIGTCVSISSTLADRYAIVSIYKTGEIAEFHRLDSAQVRVATAAPFFFVYSQESVSGPSPVEPSQGQTYTIAEAAQRIDCDTSSVRELARRARLPGFKRGHQWFLYADAVDRYRRSNRGPHRKLASSRLTAV